MRLIAMIAIALLVGCQATPTPIVNVPTLAALPSVTLTSPPTATPSETPTVQTPTPIASETTAPQQVVSETAVGLTETPGVVDVASPTQAFALLIVTETPTITLTPSLTITPTITFTPSLTFTPSPELDGLGQLALLAGRVTILPPERLYNPPTLTAVANAAATLIAGGSGAVNPIAGAPTSVGGAVAAAPACANVPGVLAPALAADASFAASIGCPVGGGFSTASAVQGFERGLMLYIGGTPGEIYVITGDGAFRRVTDTWTQGIDPESGGEIPPPGRFEPVRGFGKVWRGDPGVRAALGWAVEVEIGGASSLLPFERGRAISVPQRGQTLLFAEPAAFSGRWIGVTGGF